MNKLATLGIIVLMASLMLMPAAYAAEKKDKAAKRAAMMMQKLKQDMEAEKANMQAQFDLQKKELDEKVKAAEDQLADSDRTLAQQVRKNKLLETDIAKITAEKNALETKQQQTQAQLETTQKNLDELKAKHAQALADLSFNDKQRKTISSNLAQTSKLLNTCESKNVKLHQYGTELIKIYDNPSAYTTMMRQEKVFQLKRVELENILQDQQDKINDERFSIQNTNVQ